MINTEKRNDKTTHIDCMQPIEMTRIMQQENMNAAIAVGKACNAVSEVIKRSSDLMANGGRLFYVGCGTSGRLGVLDASECPPTFGIAPDLVIGIIAGGDAALRKAVEGAEDSFESGKMALAVYKLTKNDTVIGISAAGSAAFVLGAMTHAKDAGAFTAGITSNAGSPVSRLADISIDVETGAEVITGSTRMKAGTAQKMILNMISTGVMICLGNVYENLMINLKPSNMKLKKRMIGIVSELSDCDLEDAEKLLEKNSWNIREAVKYKKGNIV